MPSKPHGRELDPVRIRFLPAVAGGPRANIGAGPWDHKMFRGDWLLYRRIEGGRTVFEGYFEPPE